MRLRPGGLPVSYEVYKFEGLRDDTVRMMGGVEAGTSLGAAWFYAKCLRTMGYPIAYYVEPPASLGHLNDRLRFTGARIVTEIREGEPPE